jgi:oligoribonuclease NrnB/cAMP/cGMP phosphodiesterase (DHH superfamily)
MESKVYDIILFHHPCQDGLASAWVANYYHKLQNKSIEMYPIQYGTQIDLSRLLGKKIICCDWTPSLEIINKIEQIVTEIKIIDHHKTAQQALQTKPYATFDMNKSGAGLTWEYFFPILPMPNFIQMIQDRDLWTWKLPDSRNLTAGLFVLCDSVRSNDYNDFTSLFEVFDGLFTNPDKFKFCLEIGSIISKSTLSKANSLAKSHSKTINLYMKYKVCIVNCPADLTSDVGNILSSMDSIDFAVLWKYNHPKQEYYVSLRSSDKVDVSAIAKEFGGGGHPNASGFSTKINPTILFNQSHI